MADNKDEEHLDTPINNQSENPPDKIITTSDVETISSTQETENMEVHHHTHNPAESHHKKNWKSYFWEFLMLFLAVFCGFLAEWKLEHVIEHSREKEFMESMVVDLKNDKANLDKMKSYFTSVSHHIDSLKPLIQDLPNLDNNAAKIYQQQVYLNLYFKWAYSDRTINQLKNSGSFRLIRNKDVSNKITEYDGFVKNFIDDMQNNLIQRNYTSVNEAGAEIFKTSVFREYLTQDYFNYHPITLPSLPYFISKDEYKLQRFQNLIDQYAVSIAWFVLNIDKATQTATQLETLINKEYDL